jgi:MFS family permease
MPSFDTTALMLLPTGLAMLTLTTATNSYVQLAVEPSMRGRAMAIYIMCFMGGTPIGAPIVGWLAESVGPRWGMIGGGAICLVATLGLAVRFRQPKLVDIERVAQLPAAAAVQHA